MAQLNDSSAGATAESVAKFIDVWSRSEAAERANYQLFLTQLCRLLGVPEPEPSRANVAENAYVFERDVTFQNHDGTTSIGRIDLYKRGSFVLEAKQGSEQLVKDEFQLQAPQAKTTRTKKGTAVRGTKGWDDDLLR